MTQLTKVDRAILQALQRDARQSYEVIGATVGRDASVVSRRIAALIKAGVITGMAVNVDPLKAGLTTTVYMLVMLDDHGDEAFAKFEAELNAMPNVVEWARMQGVNDYVMKIQAQDKEHHIRLHAHLRGLPMVRRVRTLELLGQPHTKLTPLADSD
ncbi:MAG: Lrp/AsnC family transcriptional regulator [Proteobacteria bacterium]|nr:Lrp/AsnC family transcriptional regulator [Pseudomonadota bacterium]